MSLSRVARNIGSGYVGAAVNGAVLLVLTPLVVRHLSPRAYGIWVLATAIGSYLGFLNAGSGASAVRAVARLAGTGRIGEASRDVGSIFRIYLVVGLFACAALTILSFTTLDYFHVPATEQSEARVLLLLIAVNFLISFPMGVSRSVLAGLHRFQMLNAIEILWALLRLGATAVSLAAGYGLVSLGCIQLATSIGGHLTRWRAIRAVAPQIHLAGGPDWDGLSADVSIFSALSFGYESLRTLFDNADLLLLGILIGPAAVAVFSVGITLASFVSKGLQPISGVLFPMASEMEAMGRRTAAARLLEVGTRVNLALALPLVTILLVDGPTLLRLWVGEGFEGSYPVLAAFALANLMMAASLASSTLLFGSGRVGVLLGAEAARYVLNLGLVLLLYRRLGLTGVALGTLLAVVVADAGIVILRASRWAGLETSGFLVRSLGAPILATLPMMLILAVWRSLAPAPSIPTVALRVVVCLAGFGLIYAVAGPFREERRLVGRAWAEAFR
jgi:O-antigen/teichoic acid export membrane protein